MRALCEDLCRSSCWSTSKEKNIIIGKLKQEIIYEGDGILCVRCGCFATHTQNKYRWNRQELRRSQRTTYKPRHPTKTTLKSIYMQKKTRVKWSILKKQSRQGSVSKVRSDAKGPSNLFQKKLEGINLKLLEAKTDSSQGIPRGS
ncbi:uncharacterized protein LOC129876843 [Solanum dulcamara]|uniref:uncharacterized protein LOC129876843 n=1 Tax=Solanum dulcamara TaxID=45834 RepID=UPI0024853A5B|nr:uncharacterized protein LOC129876843 [Solanum dulcamara]